MHPGTIRTAAIVLALVCGAFFPAAAAGARAIPWMIAAMLYVVFLGTSLAATRFQRTHVHLLLANIAIAAAAYAAGWALGGRDVALAGFFAGIAPTAAAAPVVVGLLGGSVEFVLAAFLLSNIAIAILLAAVLPWLLGVSGIAGLLAITGSIAAVVAVPAVGASLTRRIHAGAAAWPRRLANASFIVWVSVLFLITAKASHYLRFETSGSAHALWVIAMLSAVTCAAGFVTGHWIGRPGRTCEASQSLGQKNTTFTIYLALAHASPLVALGPTFYVLWHNLWNAWNLHRSARHVHPSPAPHGHPKPD